MTSAALTSTGNTVMDLTGRRIEKVDKELQPSWLMRCCAPAIRFVFEALVVRSFESMAVRFTDDAIWFKGASAEFMEENMDVRGSMNSIIPRLEGLKASLLDNRKNMLALQQNVHCRQSVKQAAGFAVSGAVDLFESIEGFKWTLMELEANYSPIHEGYTAQSPEELDHLFSRIQQNA